MKKFSDYLAEASPDTTTLLAYITNSFVKLGNQETVDNRAMMLMIGAAILAQNPDAKAAGMAKRLAQLAVSKQTKKEI